MIINNMVKIHNNLCSKFRHYQKWHSFKYHQHHHWLVFGLVTLISSFAIFGSWQLNIDESNRLGFRIGVGLAQALGEDSNLLFTFVQAGDLHTSDNWHGVDNPKYNTAVRNFVSTINSERHHPKPDFIVLTGDNIEGALEQRNCETKNNNFIEGTTAQAFDELKVMLDPLDRAGIPVHMLIHNHDFMKQRVNTPQPDGSCKWGRITSDNGAGFIEIFGNSRSYDGTEGNKLNYYWTRGDFLFIVHSVPRSWNQGYGDIAWIKSVLDKHKDKKVFFFAHKSAINPRGPNYTEACDCSSNPNKDCRVYTKNASKATTDAFKAHGNVLMSFAAHNHMTASGKIKNGVRFLPKESNLFFNDPGDTIYTNIGALYEGGVYRYVKVYTDHVEVTTRSIGSNSNDPRWRFACDTDHAAANIGKGAPQERNFTLFFSSAIDPSPTATPPEIRGDLDQDGDVDIFDYNILIENFGNTNCGNVADINSDCKVDIFDYNILVENFGRTG